MSIEKAEVKLAAAHELGCRLDDVLEGARKDSLRQEGARAAFQVAARSVQDLVPVVDQDLDSGELSLEDATKVKRYLIRAVTILDNLQKQANNQQLLVSGKIQGLEAGVQVAQKFHTDESVRLQALRNPPQQAPVGEAPPSLKALRQAEAQASSPDLKVSKTTAKAAKKVKTAPPKLKR
jgi:polyhydroxyalkanoate synthesis regulator phasin